MRVRLPMQGTWVRAPGRSHMPRSGWAREPWLLSLRVWSLCSATGEATTVRGPRTANKNKNKNIFIHSSIDAQACCFVCLFCFLQYVGLSLLRPLPLRSTGSGRAGSAAMAHGPSRSVACGILPDRGTNLHPLHRQADSQPLGHQGSPPGTIC